VPFRNMDPRAQRFGIPTVTESGYVSRSKGESRIR
jgi:hypothetical protein